MHDSTAELLPRGLRATAVVFPRRPLPLPAPRFVPRAPLQVEEGTPFARWQRAGRLTLPPDDSAVAMYGEASALLRTAGYEHYEVRATHRRRREQQFEHWKQGCLA
jgi:hypothetical protein